MFSNEMFDSHDCDLPLNGVQKISVVYFRDDSYNNKKIMTGMGIDGVLYTFEITARKPIPIVTPIRRFFTARKSDKDFTELESVKIISYCSCSALLRINL